MRKFLIAGMLCAGVVMQAQAANTDLYTPDMKAYVHFGFGAPAAQSLGLHYGFRMDYNSNFQGTLGRAMPAMMQLDFSADTGFTGARLNGMTFLKRTVQLNQDGDAAVATEGGAFSTYTTLDWGLLAAGVVGVGFGIAQVAKNDETSDTAAASSTGGAGGGGAGGALCAPGSVPGVGGQCLPLSAPAGAPAVPAGGGVPAAPGGGGLCAPGAVPGIGGMCAPTAGGVPSAPSGGAPSLPSGGLPSSPVSGQCLPGDPTGMLCAPYSGSDRNYAAALQTMDVERQIWLDEGTGHMGDLILQLK